MIGRHLLGSLALALLTATSLGAQSAPLRTVTFDAGLGGGHASGNCENCIPHGASAASGFLRLGRVITPELIASLEWARWSRPQFGSQSRFDFLTVGAQWYPISGSGFSMRYAMGYGKSSYAQMVDPSVYRTERSGFAYNAGAGYDVRVSDRIIVGPFATVNSIAKGEARVNGQVAPYEVSTGLIQYGLSVGLR